MGLASIKVRSSLSMNSIKRFFVFSIFFVSAVLSGYADSRPNILLILSDDHNYRTLGVSGNKAIRTPNLDQLAGEGVYFNRNFTPNPICVPARACIYTGQDSWTNGAVKNGERINNASPVFASLLAVSGYETYFGGKWHGDGKPWTRGYTTGGRCWAGGKFDHFELALTKWGEGADTRETADRYSTTVFTDDAVKYLEDEHDRPFLMVIAYTVGHDVFLAPPGYGRKYAANEIPLPPNYMPKPPFKQFFPKIRDETVLPFPRTKASVQRATAEYYAMFEHMDDQVGRMLSVLKEKKMDENTLVIFASVKGMSMGSHGIIGKQTMYEEGIRSSLIVRHPTLKPATKINSSLVSTMDIFPTICETAKVEIPDSVEGESLLGLYDGSREGRERLFFTYHDPRRETVTRAIRTNRYKLVQHLVTGERQLFDLEKDPYEMKNLMKEPEGKTVEPELTRELMSWRKGAKDK